MPLVARPSVSAITPLVVSSWRGWRPGVGQTGQVDPAGWQWTPRLYAGSAAFYVQGRVPYPTGLADVLVGELGLDGSGRLLDVGCGPGSLTLLLAKLFERSVGLDADADMLAEAARQAAARDIGSVEWVCMRAEHLPAGLGRFRVITLAQSFHWLDRETVASALRRMLYRDGALVHVGATTHQGIETSEQLEHPRPPRAAIQRLVDAYLHELWDAGLGTPRRRGGGDEDEVFLRVGFRVRKVLTVPGRVVHRDVDDIVAGVFSLSSSTPELFGPRAAAFEAELRAVLTAASPSGHFSEQMREITLSIWSP